jgi:cell division cycle 14
LDAHRSLWNVHCSNSLLMRDVLAVHFFGRVHLVATSCGTSPPDDPAFEYLCIENMMDTAYVPFCDDFGPMNLGMVHEFCEALEKRLHNPTDKAIGIYTIAEARTLTNAVFLLGAYSIMMLGTKVSDLEATIEPIRHKLVPFRDVSPGQQNFNLDMRDCWAGLFRARDLGWVDFVNDCFDRNEYFELDDPLNADMHIVVPGKFIAMRGPKDFENGTRFADAYAPNGSFSHRDFSPAHYSEILTQFDVRTVVRLNMPEYDPAGFHSSGIAVADIYFDDCSTPPVEVVAEFLSLAEGLPGLLAVHCKAGLGRTGTLIALYMMKHHGFTAREAMGWLRIVRPGSVIGPQQQFLCDKEVLMRQCGEGFRRRGRGRASPVPDTADLAAVQARIAAVARDIRSRAAALHSVTAANAATAAAAAAAASEPATPEGAAAASDAASASAMAAAAARLADHVTSAANRRISRRASAPAAVVVRAEGQ